MIKRILKLGAVIHIFPAMVILSYESWETLDDALGALKDYAERIIDVWKGKEF